MTEHTPDLEPLQGEGPEALGGASRRDVLKKGAIVGGLVWATPAITTLSRASAGSHAPCPSTGRGTAMQSSGAVVIIPQGDSTGAEVCEGGVPPNALGANATLLCGAFDGTTASSRVASAGLKPNSTTELSFTEVASTATQGANCAGTGTVIINGMRINGQLVQIPPEPTCNFELPPDQLGPLQGIARIVLNERTCATDGTFTVTAVHVIILPTVPNGHTDLFLARSQVKNSCCAGKCSTPGCT